MILKELLYIKNESLFFYVKSKHVKEVKITDVKKTRHWGLFYCCFLWQKFILIYFKICITFFFLVSKTLSFSIIISNKNLYVCVCPEVCVIKADDNDVVIKSTFERQELSTNSLGYSSLLK